MIYQKLHIAALIDGTVRCTSTSKRPVRRPPPLHGPRTGDADAFAVDRYMGRVARAPVR